MRRAAIVSPLRTAVGKYLGTLQLYNAEELGAIAIRALVERTGIDPERIEEVCFAQGYPSCLLYTSPSPRDLSTSRMPSSA